MSHANSISRLDSALSRAGSAVTVYRGAVAVSTRARVVGLSQEKMRAASTSTGQGNYRAIMTPTGFPSGFLPLRTTDKILWAGQQRAVTFAYAWPDWAGAARIELDFIG